MGRIYPTLYVIRHGECEHNAAGWIAGQGDSPLTAAGRAHAAANGALLKDAAGDLSALDFVASPLYRASTTMELVRAAAGLDATGYRTDRRLMELDYGEHSGRLSSEVRALPEYADYLRDPWNYRRPGGEGIAVLHRRVGAFLETLTRDSVLVAHAGSVKMIRGHVLGLAREEIWRYQPPHEGVLKLESGRGTVFNAAS